MTERNVQTIVRLEQAGKAERAKSDQIAEQLVDQIEEATKQTADIGNKEVAE